MKSVSVFGLGYVGLPLAKLIRHKGFDIIGYDISEKSIEKAKEHSIKISETPQKAVEKADIIIVCVPTPVNENKLPDLNPLKKCVKSIAPHLSKKKLLIIESTIFPGTILEEIKPLVDSYDKKLGKDYLLAHCPERIDPGNEKYTIENIPRVVGGVDKESRAKASKFYQELIDAEVVELEDINAVEATKMFENSFRDINIAFVNEMAKSFDSMGIDFKQVIEGAKTKPFAFMPHYPGCGVGGHCIPVDPYYLIERANNLGFKHEFLKLARKINDGMPQYTIQRLTQAIKENKLDKEKVKICVMGLTYKKEIDDLRESPGMTIFASLKEQGYNVNSYDPFTLDESTIKTFNDCLEHDAIILSTDHNQFKELENMNLEKVKIIIDGKNYLDKEKIKQKGITYKGIGTN